MEKSIDERVEASLARSRMEQDLKWRELVKEMPFFEVPSGYQISVIPPFGGADARFLIKRPDGQRVSVYADFYNNLGCMDGPYWEVCPCGDSVGRCDIADTDTLWAMIRGEKDEGYYTPNPAD